MGSYIQLARGDPWHLAINLSGSTKAEGNDDIAGSWYTQGCKGSVGPSTCFSLVRYGLGQVAGSGLDLADAQHGPAHQGGVCQEARQVWIAGCSAPLAECTQRALLYHPNKTYTHTLPHSG